MKTCIIVSGGDAPGINAAVECYASVAARKGDLVIGARGGFAALLSDELTAIDLSAVSLLSGRGGSWLTSSREPVLGAMDARSKLASVMAQHEIDNLLLFGGDGTIRYVLPLLENWDIPCIALPTTIDNDVPGADYTLGHDSACNFAFQTIEAIKATAQALPGRIFMVETLGGDTGYLALAIAYACGADAVLLPEYEIRPDWLAQRLQAAVARQGYALVVYSEGVPAIEGIVKQIPTLTGIRLRLTRLGHAQRGADASHRDRRTAVDMSRIAYKALKAGIRIGALISHNGKLSVREGTPTQEKKPPPDYQQYAFVNEI